MHVEVSMAKCGDEGYHVSVEIGGAGCHSRTPQSIRLDYLVDGADNIKRVSGVRSSCSRLSLLMHYVGNY
jgi:hypothetical protein